MALDLRGRANRNLEIASELRGSVLTRALGDVGTNRRTGPSKLAAKARCVRPPQRFRCRVDRDGELLRALPNLESSEVLHGTTIGNERR